MVPAEPPLMWDTLQPVHEFPGLVDLVLKVPVYPLGVLIEVADRIAIYDISVQTYPIRLEPFDEGVNETV